MAGDNLAQQDQGGSNCHYVKTWLGPTLGWAMLPVMPELIVTSAAAYTVPAYASRILLNAAVKSITLPSVSQWLLATLPLANVSAFDRSLWIKDLAYQASVGSPIVLTPNGPDKIDTNASFSIVQAGMLLRLYPMTDGSGWYVG